MTREPSLLLTQVSACPVEMPIHGEIERGDRKVPPGQVQGRAHGRLKSCIGCSGERQCRAMGAWGTLGRRVRAPTSPGSGPGPAVPHGSPSPTQGAQGSRFLTKTAVARHQASTKLWEALPSDTIIPPGQAAAGVGQDTVGSKLSLNEVLVNRGAGWFLGSTMLCKLKPCRHTGHRS